jgi:hypothetical protein
MFSQINGVAGVTPFNDWFVPDTTQRHQLGTKITAVDPFWGEGEFIYIQSNDALLKGSLVMTDELFRGALLPSTAGQGFSFGVAMAPMASGTYGWIQVAGRAVIKTNATVAADVALGVAAAGIAGTNAAGKQLLNVRNRVAATGTKTFTAITYNGLNYVDINGGYDGIFLGMALSGTGIPASTVVAALDPNNKRVTMGSAIGTADKTATASGTITLTGTYTGYGSAMIQYPFAQGAIT